MNTGSLQKQQTHQTHQPGRTIICYYCGFLLREKHLQVYELRSQVIESFLKTELKIVCHTDCLKDLYYKKPILQEGKFLINTRNGCQSQHTCAIIS